MAGDNRCTSITNGSWMKKTPKCVDINDITENIFLACAISYCIYQQDKKVYVSACCSRKWRNKKNHMACFLSVFTDMPWLYRMARLQLSTWNQTARRLPVVRDPASSQFYKPNLCKTEQFECTCHVE